MSVCDQYAHKHVINDGLVHCKVIYLCGCSTLQMEVTNLSLIVVTQIDLLFMVS